VEEVEKEDEIGRREKKEGVEKEGAVDE